VKRYHVGILLELPLDVGGSNRSPTSLDARLGFDLPFVIAGQVVVFE
jgi:hypothetical protein